MRWSEAASGLVAGVMLVVIKGCALVSVAPLLPAAFPAIIAGAGGGISYTMTNIAYKTLTNPVEEVERAAINAAREMSLKVQSLERRDYSVEITARTRVHTIYLTIERLTPTLTRLIVNAKRGLVFKDKTTAFEIIYQTELALVGYAMEREGVSGAGGRPLRERVPPGA